MKADSATAPPGSSPAPGQTLAELAAKDAADDALAAAKDADAAKTDEEAASETSDDSDDDPGDDDPLAVTRFYDEHAKSRKAEVFKDDEDFFRWVGEMERTIGRRNEDALVGRQVREKLADRPDALAALFDGKVKPAAAPATDGDDVEFDQSWITLDENGRAIPAPGAPPDAMRRYGQYQRKIAKFAANPEKFIEEAMAKRFEEMEEKFAQTHQTIEQQTRYAALGNWMAANRGNLYLEGESEKGLSRQGRDLIEAHKKITEAQSDVEILDAIFPLILKGSSRGNNKTAPVPAKALRKPGVAKQAPAAKDDEARFREADKAGRSFAEVFAEIAAEQSAGE